MYMYMYIYALLRSRRFSKIFALLVQKYEYDT